MDGGHRQWVQRLLGRIREVEDIARQLHQRKTTLVEEQQRFAEETALAEQKRIADECMAEMRLAEEQRLIEERRLAQERHHAEERRIAEEKKRLTDERRAEAHTRQLDIEKHRAEERRLAERRIAMQRWYAERDRTETLKRLTEERQLAADRELAEKLHAEEECLVQEERFAEERRQWEAANRISRALSTESSRAFPTRTYHYHRLIDSTPSPTAPDTLPVCVAYRTHASKYGRVRCTDQAPDATSRRCQEHKCEYDRTISELRTAKDEHRSLSVNLHYIQSQQLHRIKACTLAQVTQSIADVTRYLSLADAIKGLAATVRRLEGYRERCAFVAHSSLLI